MRNTSQNLILLPGNRGDSRKPAESPSCKTTDDEEELGPFIILGDAVLG